METADGAFSPPLFVERSPPGGEPLWAALTCFVTLTRARGARRDISSTGSGRLVADVANSILRIADLTTTGLIRYDDMHPYTLCPKELRSKSI